jgi:hypothetical protein
MMAPPFFAFPPCGCQTDTSVRVAVSRRKTMIGLCGTNDGNQANDWTGPTGNAITPGNGASHF